MTFLRAGWFIDNARWDVASAREQGVVRSFLAPLDKRFPMVASKDVGQTAAALIRQPWDGRRIVRLEGPSRVSPNDIAEAFSAALGRPVRAMAAPRAEWEAIFRAGGMHHPEPRIRMLEGFSQGWIDFPSDVEVLKGNTTAQQVIAHLVRNGAPVEGA